MGKSTKKNLNIPKDGILHKDSSDYYLYVLDNGKEIFYVGITQHLTETKHRHFQKYHYKDYKFKIIGVFYDRNLAEFFEIKLIQECISQGLYLENKVNKFSNE